MLSDTLVDFVTRRQVYLERLKAGEVKKTDELFVTIMAEVTRLLLAYPVTHLGMLTPVKAVQLVMAIQDLHRKAYETKLQYLADFLRDLAEEERKFELASINAVTVDEVEPDDGDEDIWQAVQDRPMHDGTLLAGFLGAGVGREVTRAANLARRGIAEGMTPSALLLAYRGTADQRLQNGLIASARRNTETVVRTAMQHTSAAARHATMEAMMLRPKELPRLRRPGSDDGQGVAVNDNGVVIRIGRSSQGAPADAGIRVGDSINMLGYRWVSILDSKTSQICRSLDGQVFSFGRGPIPPAHPNCRSSIVAEIRGKWRKRDDKGRFAKDDRVRPSPSGDVPATMTYYEWLKQQPEEFQDDALGVTRAELFRKGGISAERFAALNLDRNFEPLTLAEMRKLAPRVFKRAGIK